jgi:hypothetical protein
MLRKLPARLLCLEVTTMPPPLERLRKLLAKTLHAEVVLV